MFQKSANFAAVMNMKNAFGFYFYYFFYLGFKQNGK